MIAAGIDIGTNSVRLLIVADGLEVERRVVVVGLGRGRSADGSLATEPIARTIAALEEFGNLLRAHRVERVRAVATAATREAPNREEFLDRAEQALGVRPEAIQGAEEAALSFSGASAALDLPKPLVVIDPGGGSTEFVFGSGGVEYSISIPIGSVRLTDESLPDRPASDRAIEGASRRAAGEFEAVVLPGPPTAVVGVAGTYTSLAAMHLGLETYDRESVHGATLTAEDLSALVDWLQPMTVAETAAIPSLDPARAPVILAGAVVAQEALARTGRDELVVSEFDLLDALVN